MLPVLLAWWPLRSVALLQPLHRRRSSYGKKYMATDEPQLENPLPSQCSTAHSKPSPRTGDHRCRRKILFMIQCLTLGVGSPVTVVVHKCNREANTTYVLVFQRIRCIVFFE